MLHAYRNVITFFTFSFSYASFFLSLSDPWMEGKEKDIINNLQIKKISKYINRYNKVLPI